MGCGKTVLGGKFIAIQAYFKKQEKKWINNITLHLMQLLKKRKLIREEKNHEDQHKK